MGLEESRIRLTGEAQKRYEDNWAYIQRCEAERKKNGSKQSIRNDKDTQQAR